MVPASDPVFSDFMIVGDLISPDIPVPSFPISPLSQKIGMPIHIRKIKADTAWKDDDVCGRYTNVEATWLLVALDPKSTHWAYAPMSWQNRVGSVLVTSADTNGINITPQRLEALCAYNSEFFEGPLQTAEKDGSLKAKKRALAAIMPEAFESFFEKYQAERLKTDTIWADEVETVPMATDGVAWGPGHSRDDSKPLPEWRMTYPSNTGYISLMGILGLENERSVHDQDADA